jgi:flagellar biosynthesis/type III secretory pathway protein FliH
MSINTDGPKKSGKFFKKGSKLLNVVKLVPYSFAPIGDVNGVQFDNMERSIIHAKFHDPNEIARVVRESERLNEVLIDPSRPPLAVIYPGDFTQDWLAERMSSKRRMLGFEDEDDFDLPEKAAAMAAATMTAKKMADSKQVAKVDQAAPQPPKVAAHPTDLSSVQSKDNVEPLQAEELAEHARPVSIVKEPYSQRVARETDIASQTRSNVENPIPNTPDDFIPLPLAGKNSESIPSEDEAMAQYRNREDLESQNAKVLEELKQDAKASGYKDGFRLGEEKGVLAGQAAAGGVFSRVTELIQEFEGLKRNVLHNIQKNFFELSQAVAEALLEREFSLKPEAFGQVLEKVIKDTVTDDAFKIRLHPDTWQKVIDLKMDQLTPHLVKDPSIPVGEFKVESHLTVVDGNVKKIVSQMLQNVDMELFEEHKVAS